MTSAVLFDLDGTFADTALDLAAALNHVRGLHNLPPLPLQTIRPQASNGSAGLLKLGFGIEPDAAGFSALREAFLAHYTEHICDHTRLFPGMAQLLDTLEQRGLPWGIVTNKAHRFTMPLLRAMNLADRASCIVSGDTTPHTKPHPAPLLHAAMTTPVDRDLCLAYPPVICDDGPERAQVWEMDLRARSPKFTHRKDLRMRYRAQKGIHANEPLRAHGQRTAARRIAVALAFMPPRTWPASSSAASSSSESADTSELASVGFVRIASQCGGKFV